MRLRQLVSRQWVIFSINLLFPSVKKLPWPIPIIPNFSDFSCGPQSSCRPTTSVRWEMSVWFLMKFPSINKWLFRIDINNTNRNYGLPSLYWKKYFPKKVLKSKNAFNKFWTNENRAEDSWVVADWLLKLKQQIFTCVFTRYFVKV